MTSEVKRERLQVLDYARFATAASVLIFHYFFNGIVGGMISNLTLIPVWSDVAKYGYLGVHLFFIISGYVIFFSAKGKSARQFAVSRSLRIYPTFVVAVAITSVAITLFGGAKMSVSLPQALTNLTFAPSIFGYGLVDGAYWTLLMEVKFYALVLIILMAGLGDRLEAFFIAWPPVMLVGTLLGLQNTPFLGGYYTYFAAGSLFAIVGRKSSLPAVASLVLACGLCLAHAVLGADSGTVKGLCYRVR